MKRVKVILAGLLREWDICSTGFSKWNLLDPNVQFDFYLTTWAGSDIYSKDERLNLRGVSIHSAKDMFDLMCENKVNYHIEADRHTAKTDIPQIQHYYSYLLYNAAKLGKNEKYDRVLLTRPDVLIEEKFLELIIQDTEENMRPRTILTGDISIWHKQLFIGTDIGFYGLPEDIYKFCNMFEDIYIKDIFPAHIMHVIQPEYMSYRGITPIQSKVSLGKIVRDNKEDHAHLFIDRKKAKKLVSR